MFVAGVAIFWLSFESGLHSGGVRRTQTFHGGRRVIDHSGTVETIASGFTTPTAMTFGPDGALYVSNFGFGAPVQGLGQIVRVVVPD